MGELDNVRQEKLFPRIPVDSGNEKTVDFDDIRFGMIEQFKPGIPGTEIVQRDAHAKRLDML